MIATRSTYRDGIFSKRHTACAITAPSAALLLKIRYRYMPCCLHAARGETRRYALAAITHAGRSASLPLACWRKAALGTHRYKGTQANSERFDARMCGAWHWNNVKKGGWRRSRNNDAASGAAHRQDRCFRGAERHLLRGVRSGAAAATSAACWRTTLWKTSARCRLDLAKAGKMQRRWISATMTLIFSRHRLQTLAQHYDAARCLGAALSIGRSFALSCTHALCSRGHYRGSELSAARRRRTGWKDIGNGRACRTVRCGHGVHRQLSGLLDEHCARRYSA